MLMFLINYIYLLKYLTFAKNLYIFTVLKRIK